MDIQQVLYRDCETKHPPFIYSASISLIDAGKELDPFYPGCEVTALERILSEEFDLYFHFHKELPQFSFYPVPFLYIFAIDSHGGSFVSTNRDAKNADCERADIYYLDRNRDFHWLATNMADFLCVLVFCPDWKQNLGLDGISSPIPSEIGRAFLINTYQLTDKRPLADPPEQVPLIFPSLSEAKKIFPFLTLDDVAGLLK